MGVSAAQHDAIIVRLKAIVTLREQGLTIEDAAGRRYLADQLALAGMARETERLNQAFGEIEGVGTTAVDRFADLISQGKVDWASWSDAGRQAVQDVIREFVRLELENPLLNAVFGGNRATGADAGGILGKLFGGGKTAAVNAANDMAGSAAKTATEASLQASKLAAITAETTATSSLTVAIVGVTPTLETLGVASTAQTAALGAMTAAATAATAALEAMAAAAAAGSAGDAGSGLAGLFGSLLGAGSGGAGLAFDASTFSSLGPLAMAGFATGTDSAPGGLARVNEQGGEILNLPKGTQVIPHDVSMALARSGGDTHVSIPITIDARGSGPNEVQALRAELRNLQASLPGTIVATVNDQKQRRRIAA